MPRRFQLQRIKGWRMPLNTVSVARRGQYGNPHTMRDGSKEERRRAVEAYHTDLQEGRLPYSEADLEHELRGVNAAFYCSEDEDWHVDVVLESANR